MITKLFNEFGFKDTEHFISDAGLEVVVAYTETGSIAMVLRRYGLFNIFVEENKTKLCYKSKLTELEIKSELQYLSGYFMHQKSKN